MKITPGVHVVNYLPFIDTDEHGNERTTEPMLTGWVNNLNHTKGGVNHWDVHWPNGAAIVLSDIELNNAADWHLRAPHSIRAVLLHMRWATQTAQMTMYDPEVAGTAQDLCNSADHLLHLLDEVEELRDVARVHRGVQRAVANPTEQMKRFWSNQIAADEKPSPLFVAISKGQGQQPAGHVYGWSRNVQSVRDSVSALDEDVLVSVMFPRKEL